MGADPPASWAGSLAVTTNAEETALWRILAEQVRRYPEIGVQDLYKLIYQAALGCEHAAHDEDTARDWLEREVGALETGPQEPTVDPLSPDGRIVRINLRPYAAERGDLGALLAAFLQTANEYRGTLGQLERYWVYAEGMAAEGRLPFAPAQLRAFFAARRAERFPAIHHSAPYREAYRPAYRVVSLEYLPGHALTTAGQWAVTAAGEALEDGSDTD